MKRRELIDKCYRSLGLARLDKPGASPDTFGTVMPFVAMDQAYCAWHDSVDKREWRHMLRKLNNEWHEAYNCYNDKLFRKLPEDVSYELITEYFEAFGEAIHNTMVMLKSALMETLPAVLPFEDKKFVATIYCSYSLTVLANAFCRKYYRTVTHRGTLRSSNNPYIDTCAHKALSFIESYLKQVTGEELMIKQEVIDLVKKMTRDAVAWTKRQNELMAEEDGGDDR